MKILSKYKDYYDYLSGIYGEDPKLILDRRDFEHNTYRFLGGDKDIFTLYICEYIIQGIYYNGSFYYGEKLLSFDNIKEIDSKSKNYWYWDFKYKNGDYYKINNGKKWDNDYILNKPIKDPKGINKKYNCPILLRSSIGSRTNNVQVERWPILGNMNLGSYIPAEEIYQWLVNWLSQRENDKENQRNTQLSDKEKITNKGFDNKRSFRPKMK